MISDLDFEARLRATLDTMMPCLYDVGAETGADDRVPVAAGAIDRPVLSLDGDERRLIARPPARRMLVGTCAVLVAVSVIAVVALRSEEQSVDTAATAPALPAATGGSDGTTAGSQSSEVVPASGATEPSSTEASTPPSAPAAMTTVAALPSVAVAGDVAAAQIGESLRTMGVDGTTIVSKVSSGLVRDDFVDWAAEVQRILDERRAGEPLVLAIGRNDSQPFLDDTAEFGSAQWTTRYTERVTAVARLVLDAGHPLVWVLPSAAGLPDQESQLVIVRDAITAAIDALGMPGVVIVDPTQLPTTDTSTPDVVVTTNGSVPSATGSGTPTNGSVPVSSVSNPTAPSSTGAPSVNVEVPAEVVRAIVALGYWPAFEPYVIRAGDYLGLIAARHATTIEALVTVNQWEAGAQQPIFPGQLIAIPPATGPG